MREFARTGLLVLLAMMLPLRTVLAQSAKIEYKTVAEAYDALQQRKDLQKSTDGNGWLRLSSEHSPSTWYFAPANDPAYPAVVKQDMIDRSDGIYIATGIKCEGPDEACKTLARRFEAMNAEIRQRVLTGHP